MNAEEILTEVYWNLSTLDCDQIKYPDHDTLIKQLKKYMNSRYGIIIAKEGKMAGFLNEQVQEWYEKNKDLLGVIDKLTKRCEKLEEENTNLKDENKILKDEFDIKVKVVKEQNNCLARKNTTIKELRQKITAITDINALDFNAIFTSLGVNDTRSALDKIMEMKKTIKQNEEENRHLKDEFKAAVKDGHISVTYEYDIHTSTEREENDRLRKKVKDLQEAYDNCVNECSDHVIEIDSLLQNLEAKTVEEALDKIRLIKRDGVFITMDFDSELRVENERLKRKIEDLRKDVQFEFHHRMEALSTCVDREAKIAELKQENARLKNFMKDRTKDIHSMTEEIEKCLAKYREEEKNHD